METISTKKHHSIFSELLIELAERNVNKGNEKDHNKKDDLPTSNYLQWSDKECNDFFFNPLTRFSNN